MVSPLLAKSAPTGLEIVNVTPERAGWTHVGFRAVRLSAGESETVDTGTRELCLVVLTEKHVIRMLLIFGKHIRTETFIAVYRWIKEFRPLLLTASYLIVVTTSVFVALPLITMYFVSRRNKRLERIKAIVENR